jgi:arsenate reductase
MITIYHNNRCSKSRSGLELITNSGKEFKVVNYLETPPTTEELTKIIEQLGITPIQLVRKNEAIWKTNFKDKTLNDTQVIEAMVAHPKLIERPIVINNGKAVIGRPPSLVLDIL